MQVHENASSKKNSPHCAALQFLPLCMRILKYNIQEFSSKYQMHPPTNWAMDVFDIWMRILVYYTLKYAYTKVKIAARRNGVKFFFRRRTTILSGLESFQEIQVHMKKKLFF